MPDRYERAIGPAFLQLTLHIDARPGTIALPPLRTAGTVADHVGDGDQPARLLIGIRDRIVPVSPAAGERWTSIRLDLSSGALDISGPSDAGFDPLPLPDDRECKTGVQNDKTLRIVADWYDLTVTFFSGRHNDEPLFLIDKGLSEMWLVSGVASLRAQGASTPISANAVNFFLGFGHNRPEQLLFDGVHPLYPGRSLIVRSTDDGGRDVSPLVRSNGELSRTASQDPLANLQTCLAPDVAGKSVALVASSCSSCSWMAEALKMCGAAEVKVATLGGLSLSAIQTAMIVHTGQPHSDPGLLLDASAAVTAAAEADVVVIDWGIEGVFTPPAAFVPFVKALAGMTEMSTRSMLGGFLKSNLFARDVLFDQICAFPDEERFLVLGPQLLGEGFAAMADQLGTDLDQATLEEAAGARATAEVSRINRAFKLECSAIPLLFGLRSMVRKPVLAPFLSNEIAAATHSESVWQSPSAEVATVRSDNAEIPPDAKQLVTTTLRSVLHSNARLFRMGFVARTPTVRALTNDGDATRQLLHQQLTLLGLEKWLKTLRSVSEENRHGE